MTGKVINRGLLEAYLHCELKAYLKMKGEVHDIVIR